MLTQSTDLDHFRNLTKNQWDIISTQKDEIIRLKGKVKDLKAKLIHSD